MSAPTTHHLWPTNTTLRSVEPLSENTTPRTLDPALTKHRGPKYEPGEQALLETPAYLIEQSKDAIRDAAERRIALFFQQLIVCWNTPFHFEIGHRQEDHVSARAIKKEGDPARKPKVPFQAAHSAVIPWVYACPIEDWQAYIADRTTPKPKLFVYLQNSDQYHGSISTMEILRQANQVDSAIDGHNDGGDNKLRARSIQIINQVAAGDLRPEDGLKKFITEYETSLTKFLRDDTDEVRQGVATLYRAQARLFRREIKDDKFLDKLLGVKLGASVFEDKVRADVFRRRFALLREVAKTQSTIMRYIDLVRIEVQRGRKKPPGLERVIKAKVVEMASVQNRATLIRLFKLGPDELAMPSYKKEKAADLNLTAKDRGQIPSKARELVGRDRHKTRFSNLMRDIRTALRDVRRLEDFYRADICRHFRQAKGWTQEGMADAYKAMWVGRPMSQANVSFTENTKPLSRSRQIDLQTAGELAALVGVDKGLFFPAVFSSRSLDACA